MQTRRSQLEAFFEEVQNKHPAFQKLADRFALLISSIAGTELNAVCRRALESVLNQLYERLRKMEPNVRVCLGSIIL